jgi:N,N'-diacetyllegionaminate synthase
MLYPPPDEELNLNFIDSLHAHFSHPIGFSDHTMHTWAAALAVAKGAVAIEKHFTLDREQDGADHKNSLDPQGFGDLVSVIRRCEAMLGDSDRPLGERESRERVFARRGVYAARNLKRGETVDGESVDFLRPNTGIGAEQFEGLKNRKLMTDVKKGVPLTWSMFERNSQKS